MTGEIHNTKVVVIASAEGGSGKTTLGLGFAEALTKNYKKVLYIEASELQSFQYMLNNSSPISDNEIYEKLNSEKRDVSQLLKICIRKEGFYYLPPFKCPLLSLGLDLSLFSGIIEGLKRQNDFDIILVECESSYSAASAEILSLADRVICIASQTLSSVVKTNRFVDCIADFSTDKYVFICNKYDTNKDNYLLTSAVDCNFTVSEYIESLDGCEKMSIADLSSSPSILKSSLLLL